MAPHVQTPLARLGCWAGLGLCCIAAAITVGGCDVPGSGSEPVRTEPWRKDEVALSRAEREVVRYRAERGQSLSFTIQSKQGVLRGQVPLSGAELSIDPRALDHSRGELAFDLDRLSVEQFGGGEGAATTEDPLLTRAARAWLNLGSEVSRSERAEARSAHFGIRLGRALSSHSIQGGQVIGLAAAGGPAKSATAGSVRRVSGIVEGDLLLLGREVTHVLRVEVDFLSSAGEGPNVAPASVVVRLLQAEAVPLAEHGVLPKDERGDLVAEQVAALGRRSNLRAAVTGSLSFVRSAD